ncbi:MAG: type VII toxin-antitoxin system HepT family RNase toxin [Desulfosalsimonas sp.]
MVDLEKISAKFEMLDGFLEILGRLSKTDMEKYLEDPVLIGSMRYYLQVSIECCLDVASHVISSERYRAPKDYADAFNVLEEKKIIKPELAQRLRQMAKFRNRLVHLYGEIDDRAVYRIACEDLKDIQTFRDNILNKFQ